MIRHLRHIRRHRRAESAPSRASDPTTTRILDTAIGVMVDFGVARTSVELVAEIADVSDEAIYRRWPERNDLLQAAMARELTLLCGTAFDAAAKKASDFDTIVSDAFSRIVWSIRSHPLMDLELGTESDVTSPLLINAAAPVMRTAVTVFTQNLRRIADVTEVRLDDADALADILVRLAHSMLVVPHPAQPLTSRVLVDEYVRRYALPIVAATARSAADDLGASTDDGAFHRPGRGRPIPEVVTATLVAVLIGSAAVTAVHMQPVPSPATPREMNEEKPPPQPIPKTTVPPSTTTAPVIAPAPVASTASDEPPPPPASSAVSYPAPTDDVPSADVIEQIRDDEGLVPGRRLPPGARSTPPPMGPPSMTMPSARAGVPPRPAPGVDGPAGGPRPPRRGPAGHAGAGPR